MGSKGREHNFDQTQRQTDDAQPGDANDPRLERVLDAVPDGVAALSLNQLVPHDVHNEAAALGHDLLVGQDGRGHPREELARRLGAGVGWGGVGWGG